MDLELQYLYQWNSTSKFRLTNVYNYDKISNVWKKALLFSLLIQRDHRSMGYKPKGGEIMNKYESVIIINPSLEEEGIKGLIQRFTDLINTDGKLESVEEMGKKKLAYEVKKNKEGYYVLFNFEAKPELIAELERNYRITDEVIKFIVVRKED